MEPEMKGELSHGGISGYNGMLQMVPLSGIVGERVR